MVGAPSFSNESVDSGVAPSILLRSRIGGVVITRAPSLVKTGPLATAAVIPLTLRRCASNVVAALKLDDEDVKRPLIFFSVAPDDSPRRYRSLLSTPKTRLFSSARPPRVDDL